MEITSFASATWIVIAVNRIIALRPLCDSDTKFWSLLNYSYKAITVISICYALYTFYIHEFQIHLKIDNIVYLCLRVMNCLCFFSIHALSWNHEKEIPELNRKIADLEENITKLGIVINYRIILLWIIITYSVTCLSVSLLYGLCGYFVWDTYFILQQIYFNYVSNMGAQVHLDFLTYVCWLKCSFKQTNDLLKKFLVEGYKIKTGELSDETAEIETNRKTVKNYLNKWMPEYSVRRTQVVPFKKVSSMKHELQTIKNVHMLQEIRCVHLHLCGIVKLVNNMFASQLEIHSFMAVMNLVAILYFVYLRFKDSDINLFIVGTALIKIIDSLYIWMKIIVVNYVCESTVTEMKKVIEIIHQCTISDFDTELKDEILQFSLQLSLNQIGNSKSNFFNLNSSFLRQCIRSIITYLIILIQWTEGMELEHSSLSLNTTNAVHK